jgi:diketogulonate reductase-like aldo/keto reductase
LHPYLPQHELLKFCKENDIHVTAYSPLGSVPKFGVLANPTVQSIAQKHGKTPAQILLAWGIQRGTSVIPKSSKAERILENFESVQVQLSTDEMAALDRLHETHGKRCIDPVSFWKVDLFTEEAA